MEARLASAIADRPAPVVPSPPIVAPPNRSELTNPSRMPKPPGDFKTPIEPPSEPASAEIDMGPTSELVASESINAWPDEAAESAFLAESRRDDNVADPAKVTSAKSSASEEPAGPLPSLNDLVNRIPADTRELLDELFRAKFTTVRRVKAADLKA